MCHADSKCSQEVQSDVKSMAGETVGPTRWTSFVMLLPTPPILYVTKGMDSPGEWHANALLSPSKARAQQAQARDWASVESWLSKHYSKRQPSFERNEETLQAFLSLATVNEDADDQRALCEKLQRAAIQTQAAGPLEGQPFAGLLDGLDASGLSALESMAEIAVRLNSADTASMARHISRLTADDFELAEQCRRADAQREALDREQDRLQDLVSELQSNVFQAGDHVQQEISDWTRDTKHLKAKLCEYEERLSAPFSVPSPTLEDMTKQQASLAAQRKRLQALEEDLTAFHSLPTDYKAAKARLESTRAELAHLVAKRERLFESLVQST